MPVSMTSKRSKPSSPADLDPHDDLAGVRELDGVADQVDQDLAQPHRIAAHRCRARRDRCRRPAPAPWHGRAPRRSRWPAPTVSRKPNSMRSSSSLPASTFEKSRMSLMICSSASAECEMVCDRCRCRGVSSVACSSSDMPMTPFIGVRISWLMRARNSLLALLARSAASLARVASSMTSLQLAIGVAQIVGAIRDLLLEELAIFLQARVAMPDLRRAFG